MMTPDTHDFATTPCRPSTLVELLRWRARQQPERRAYTFLVDGDSEEVSLTYAALDHKVRAIGASLQSLRMTGERALLLYPPGLEYIAAFFGCLYAGAVAVPVYPPRQRTLSRLLNILSDAQAKVALTTAAIRSTIEQLPPTPALRHIHWLVADSGSEEDRASRWQMPAVSSDTLAFLQYTSGSTGTPKGVMLRHSHLLHNQRLIQQAMGQTEHSVVLGWLPLYHDMGLIGNVFQPLYVGIPGILMSPLHFLQQPWHWLQAITRYRATTSGGPNFAYDLCVRKITSEQRTTLDLSSWRVAFNGAEPVHAATLERFATAFKPCGFRREAFYPCYGLAEATLMVAGGDATSQPTRRTFAGAALQQHRAVRSGVETQGTRTLVGCGRSLLGQQIVIVDPVSLTPCPAGQVGEIWVQGRSVAGGYWNRPEETAAIFQARLLDSGAGPFLRTGDLGFVDDGELFVTGRCKDLLIIRGCNHYPQDIELTVQQAHPALRPGCGAAFAVEVDEAERLVIVQEAESHQPVDLDEVTTAIRRVIAAEHEVQVYAIVLIRPGSLPKTSSGKIQRYACSARFLAGELEDMGRWQEEKTAVTEAYVAPRSAVEEVVAAIWAQVFGVAQVGIDDNFFALGGDSLHSAQVIARVREILQVELTPEHLFAHPTVSALCERIERTRSGSQALSLPPLRPIARHGDLLLSCAQQRQWFLEQWTPGLPVFNIPVALRLQGNLNEAALAQSLNTIVQRHETLRTTFPYDHGQPVQRIAAVLRVPLPVIDLQRVPAPERDTQALQLATGEARRPFDLAHGPLLRATLLRLATTNHLLILSMHHIVADFWSMRVLLHELATLYQVYVTGSPDALPALTIQYADFSSWQQQWLQGEALDAHLAYWQKQLAGAPPVLKLPTDRPRPAVQTFSGALQPLALGSALTADLARLSRQEGGTLFMTLLAAFQTFLHHYTAQTRDMVIGIPIAGRNRLEVEGLIGYFLNTLALRTDLSGNPSFREILQRVSRKVLEAYAYQELPFEKLVESLRPERSPQHTPVFQVVFNFQNVLLPALQFPDLTLTPLELDTGMVKHDLILYMRQTSEGLAGTLAYNTDLFQATTVAGMADDLVTLMQRLVADPDARLETLGTLLQHAGRPARPAPQPAAIAPRSARFGQTKRQSIRVSPARLVQTKPLRPGEMLPLLVQPALQEVEVTGWAMSQRPFIATALLQHGAILLRGFKVDSASVFQQFAAAVTPHLLDYLEGASPRLPVGDKVYTSTEYPAAYAIAMHNELSYSHTWPGTIFFCCLQAPQQGGETPLADSRKVFALMAPEIRERFRQKGVQYVRNFHGGQGSGQSWQTAFATTDRAVVESYCREGGINWRWKADGGLWISQVRPASIRHPQTGEMVWFNQAHQWHLSNLEPEVARALGATVPERDLPMHAYYGDGSPLEPAVLEAIRAAYRQVTVTFPWQAGDVLLLDNMLTAHGRMPFVGPRTVLVAMGAAVSLHDVKETP